ncbi:MAG: hypothetical protein E7163_02325 [Firmicutes bacterium]|nr:hypothetical protein [Bacillota bacterium]
MYISPEDWKDLKKSIDDLFWDNDRMSSSGRYTLNHISNLINKIDKNKSDKLYVVMENDVTNDECYNTIIGVTFSKKEARTLLKNAVKELKQDIDFNNLDAKDINSDEMLDYDGEWLFDKNKDSFSLYLNGEYNSEHFEISIREVNLTYEKDKNKEKELG